MLSMSPNAESWSRTHLVDSSMHRSELREEDLGLRYHLGTIPDGRPTTRRSSTGRRSQNTPCSNSHHLLSGWSCSRGRPYLSALLTSNEMGCESMNPGESEYRNRAVILVRSAWLQLAEGCKLRTSTVLRVELTHVIDTVCGLSTIHSVGASVSGMAEEGGGLLYRLLAVNRTTLKYPLFGVKPEPKYHTPCGGTPPLVPSIVGCVASISSTETIYPKLATV